MFDGIDATVTPFLVGPSAWPVFRERVHPHLVKMADGSGGRYDIADVLYGVEVGHIQLWLALENTVILCVMATEVIQYPRFRALRCIGVVGHRPRRWMHLLASVERAAKEHFGCERMEALTQVGHQRLLATGGWQAWHVLSEKVL